MTNKLEIEKIVNGPFMENCYLVWEAATGRGAFIDPGAEAEKLLGVAASRDVTVEAILNTHGHIDHAGAAKRIAEQLGVPFAMHPADQVVLDTLPAQAQMFGVGEVAAPRIDRELADGDTVNIGSIEGKVLHTPGHTPGGVCFLFDGVVFVGDTLFAGSVGRTDLPGGSTRQLLDSINSKLMVLDDGVTAFSGHGPETTIGNERRHNPFLRGGAMW